MQIKYGINFYEQNLLLLNEIQYSKNIIGVLYELLQDTQIKTIIIATGIIQTHEENYLNLIQSGKVKTITIHPLGFFDFLDYK
jgi:predicted AAA+ superfamily ATPase